MFTQLEPKMQTTYNMNFFHEKLIKNVQCSLCNDTLIEPKILPCFHTFCKLCIKRHAELIDEVNVFKCTECKSEYSLPELSSVEDLKPSLLHSRMLKVLEFVESEKVCSVSESHPRASWYCLDRSRLLCNDCATRSSIINKDHQSISLKGITKFDLELILKRENLCQYHEQMYEFYCKDCEECICIYCFRSRQCRDHETISLKESSFLAKERLEQLKTNEDEMQKQLETQKEIIITIKNDGEKAKRAIKETVKRLIEMLQKSERELIKEVDRKTEEAEQKQKKGQDNLDQTRRALEYVTKMKEFGVVSEISKAVKDTEDYAIRSVADIANIIDSRFKFVLSHECSRFINAKHGLGSLQQTDMTMAIHVDPEPEVLKKTKLTLVAKTSSENHKGSRSEALEVKIKRENEPNKVEKFPRNYDAKIEVEIPKATGQLAAQVNNASQQISNTQSRENLNAGADPGDVVDVKIFSENDVNLEEKKVMSDGKIEIEFMAKVAGPLTAEVKVNGNHVSNSPLVMNVKPQQMRITGEFRTKSHAHDTSMVLLAAIAVDKDNSRVAVADWSSHCVHVFDTDGQFLLTYGSQGSGEGQLSHPQGLVFLKETDLVIADCDNHRICIVNTATGRLVNTFGKQGNGDGEFNEPYGIHVDDDGNIIVCDHDNHRIQVFTRDGDYQYQFGLPGQDNFVPISTVTHCGRFYASDYSNSVIHVFEKNKHGVPTRISTIDGAGSADGQLNGPCGLAIDNDHHLLVCDLGNNRIQKFTLDGRLVGKSDGEIEKPCEIAVWKGRGPSRPSSPHSGRPSKKGFYGWVGCYNDRRHRAIRKQIANYRGHRSAVKKCARLARRRGYKVFAVQYGGQCFSGPRAHLSYSRYGPSNKCRRGLGGSYANDVYRMRRRGSVRNKNWHYLFRGCYKGPAGHKLADLRRVRHAIRRCARLAKRRGYKAFALRNRGICYSGPRAHLVYSRKRKLLGCSKRSGGPRLNSVYVIRKGRAQSKHSLWLLRKKALRLRRYRDGMRRLKLQRKRLRRLRIQKLRLHKQRTRRLRLNSMRRLRMSRLRNRRRQRLHRIRILRLRRRRQRMYKLRMQKLRRHQQRMHKLRMQKLRRHQQRIHRLRMQKLNRHRQRIQRLRKQKLRRHRQRMQRLRKQRLRRRRGKKRGDVLHPKQKGRVQGRVQGINQTPIPDHYWLFDIKLAQPTHDLIHGQEATLQDGANVVISHGKGSVAETKSTKNASISLGDFKGKCFSDPDKCKGKGMTVMTSMKLDTTTLSSNSSSYIMSTGGQTTKARGFALVHINNQYVLILGTKTKQWILKTPSLPKDWFNLAFTWQSDGQLRLFVNGKGVASSKAIPLVREQDMFTSFTIGRPNNSHTLKYKLGLEVDSVALWQKALTDQQVFDVIKSGVNRPKNQNQATPKIKPN